MSNKKSSTNVPTSTPSKKTTAPDMTQSHSKSNPGMMNGKHHQVPVKKQVISGNVREASPERKANHTSTGQKSSLMELLFAASEKQKVHHQPSHQPQPNQRTRKATSPSVNSSSAYAGAAFDRAPTGESFPVPSFLSKTSAADESLMSASCPLPAGPMAARASKDQKPASVQSSPQSRSAKTAVLKSVSIQDLLGSPSQPSTPSKVPHQPPSSSSSNNPPPPSKPINVSKCTSEGKNLSSLTQDLRRMLNIAK